MADASLGRRPPEDEGPFHSLRNWLRQLTRARNGETTSLREELEELIEEHKEEQPIDPHERTLLTNILKLHALKLLKGKRMSEAVEEALEHYFEKVRLEHEANQAGANGLSTDDVIALMEAERFQPTLIVPCDP